MRFIVGTHRFWPRPALVVPSCIGLALLAIGYDHAAARSDPDSGSWGYPGGGEGARSLLSAVASSSIGVAGTISSATLAPRSLATPTSPSRRHGQGAETRLGWEDGEKRYGAFTASTRA